MHTPFVRDRFTWLAYLLLGYYAYMQASIGPAAVFIRADLNLDYTQQALHISAFALGMLLAGLTNAQAARWVGRRVAFWGGGLGMTLGALLLIQAQSVAVTITSTLCMGLIGSYLLGMIQAALSDHHGTNRAYALTEANVVAALTAGLAPIMVGQGAEAGFTWRLAFVIGIAGWLIAAFTSWRVPLPETPTQPLTSTPRPGGGRLPRVFWAYWLVVFFSVAVEWCLIFWAASFLVSRAGLSPESAATLSTIFFITYFAGRFAGSRLTRRFDSRRLLLLAGLITLAGFPLFWLGTSLPVNLIGLALCGLGIANLFPLTLATAATIGINNPNAASGFTSMSAGTAILIVPQVLGTVADQVGIFNAYGLTLPLILAILVVTVLANRALGKQS